MLRILLFHFLTVSSNFAVNWSFNLADLFQREVFPFISLFAELLLVVNLLLYELNILCIFQLCYVTIILILLNFQLYCWIFSIATTERWLDSKAI